MLIFWYGTCYVRNPTAAYITVTGGNEFHNLVYSAFIPELGQDLRALLTSVYWCCFLSYAARFSIRKTGHLKRSRHQPRRGLPGEAGSRHGRRSIHILHRPSRWHSHKWTGYFSEKRRCRIIIRRWITKREPKILKGVLDIEEACGYTPWNCAPGNQMWRGRGTPLQLWSETI